MIRFFVPGIPAPGGSKQPFISRTTGKALAIDDCKRNPDWRAMVGWAGVEHCKALLAGPLRVEFYFIMPRPQSHFGSGKNAGKLKASAPEYHTTRPDTTKLIRAAEDALTGIAWRDDAQIAHQIGEKHYGEKPGVWIVVEQLGEEDSDAIQKTTVDAGLRQGLAGIADPRGDDPGGTRSVLESAVLPVGRSQPAERPREAGSEVQGEC